jgi:putative ABC transport system permease protein
MSLIQLAIKSLWNRRFTAILTICSIAISVALLLGVRQISSAVRNAFTNTISGADLIVGARSGPINLLLYSVFRLGDATNNISWESVQKITRLQEVDWVVPLSLGDSHRGFRVLGTDQRYFEHYHYARERKLAFAGGHAMTDLYDAVLGAEVARTLDYKLGDRIVLSHGAGNVSFANHSDKPFVIAGILRPTGTPVDRTVHVSLEAIEAIHIDWQSGMPAPAGARVSAEQARQADLTPTAITALLVGLKSKIATFAIQRAVNDYRGEPLLAILPGVTLQQLWSMVGVVESAITVICACVVVAGLLCLLTTLLASLNERRREMAILRSVGARPVHVFALLISEAGVLAFCGVLLGMALDYALLFAAQPILQARFGLVSEIEWPGAVEWLLLGMTLSAALVIGMVPAWRAYRRTLADGLTIQV